MTSEADDFLPDLPLKTRDHRQCDNHHRHADGNSRKHNADNRSRGRFLFIAPACHL